MGLRIRKSSIFDGIIYALVFLVGFQFDNQPHVYVFLLGFCGLLFFWGGRIPNLPGYFLVLIAAFTSYFFVFKENARDLYLYHYCAYWLGPIICFFVGYLLIAHSKSDAFLKV